MLAGIFWILFARQAACQDKTFDCFSPTRLWAKNPCRKLHFKVQNIFYPTMMKLSLALLFVCFCQSIQAQSSIQLWPKVDKPTSIGGTQSIGKYTAGCLRGAKALAWNGSGYQVMRLSRKRYYGHPDLVDFIEQLGQDVRQQGLGTLLIGDLGQARGGPTLTGHRSHQTGLDVDIWYTLNPEANKRQLTSDERESWSSPSVVKAGESGMDFSHWSVGNEKVLELAAGLPNVDRIFVNAQIKRHLCGNPGNRRWLEKIRPWYAHADHFHVRLKCPVGNKSCEKQEPVPAGDGCGADLAWWFSEDAKKPKKKGPPLALVLPKECDAVLYE
jgi:penicillin-insensitive murein DD-endopeptidase